MQFKYKAYNNLLLDLGRNDYVVELSEIAIKDFLFRLENSKTPEIFLEEKCKEHKIWISLDNKNSSYNQSILGYIANVYHLFEAFLYETKDEYKDLTEESFSFDTNGTKLNQYLKYFTSKNRFNNIDKIDEYLINVFEYYHVLRVYFSHKKTTTKGEINTKWQKAIKHFNSDLLEKYKVKNGPKEIEKLDFEDYFLFTQISKDLALRISSLCYPEANKFAKKLNRFKKYQVEEEIIKRVEIHLTNEYGFKNENDSDKLFLKTIFTNL